MNKQHPPRLWRLRLVRDYRLIAIVVLAFVATLEPRPTAREQWPLCVTLCVIWRAIRDQQRDMFRAVEEANNAKV